MSTILLFPAKDPSEVRKLKFELADELNGATINAGTLAVAVATVWGVDASPSQVLTANPHEISGTDVYVWVDAGVAGVDYEIRLQFDTDESPARTIVMKARLPVRTAK